MHYVIFRSYLLSYLCVNLFKYVLRQNMHQIISEFSKNHYSGFVVTEKLNSCLQTLTISRSLASFAESAIFALSARAVYERAKIQMTNANKLKIEKRNIFWATEKYRIYLPKLSDL